MSENLRLAAVEQSFSQVTEQTSVAGRTGYMAMLAIGMENTRSCDHDQTVDVNENERMLRKRLNDAVGRIDFEQIAVPTPGRRQRPDRNFDAYRLITLRSNPAGRPSLGAAGYVKPKSRSITVTYKSGGEVYLDAMHAIGLAKNGKLIAVASAGIDRSGALKVVQIQDVTSIRRDDPNYFKSGLHDGFRWRDALVMAWESVAIELGISRVIVQGYQNNTWYTVRSNPVAGKAAYDAVAERLSYVQREDNNWEKYLWITDATDDSPGGRLRAVLRKLQVI